MALNNTTADACAAAVVNAIVTDPAQQANALVHWQGFLRVLYAQLKIDITTTILPGVIDTTGSSSAQFGPQAPVPINPD